MIGAVKKNSWCQASPEDFLVRPMPLQHLAPLGSGVVHLWLLDISALGMALQNAMGGPAPEDGQGLSLAQLRFARRFYLRLLLGAYLDIPGKSVRFLRSVRGKPAFDHSVHATDLQFSMAKSGDRVLIGVSRSTAIGVDLEPSSRTARDALRLARRYFSTAESDALHQLQPDCVDAAFLHAWACKEAVVKASGHGIANRFNCFTVNTNPREPAVLLHVDDDDASAWQIAIVCPDHDFIGAVATRQQTMSFETFRLQSRAISV